MTASRGPSADVSVAWFAVVLVAVIGYGLAFRLIEARIEERLASSAHSADRLRAAGRVVAERPQLAIERTRLRLLLGHVTLGGDGAQLVARFVHDAARIAERSHATITAIAATASAPIASGTVPLPTPLVPASPPQGSGVAGVGVRGGVPLEAIPLEVTVEGRYVDLLAALRELSLTRELAHVEVASLARKNVDAPDTTLTATLHVTLVHIARLAPPLATPPEPRDVRTRP